MDEMELRDGCMWLASGALRGALSVSCWTEGSWRPMSLSPEGPALVARLDGVEAWLVLTPQGGRWRYELAFQAERLTRLQLELALPQAREVFHLIPANIYGDNNLPRSEPGHFPNLTTEHAGNVSCSPRWELRADRASHPVSIMCFDGGVAGVSIVPYSDCDPGATNSAEGFVRNGVFARLAHEETADACGVTLGYRNDPRSFVNKDTWADPTEHRAAALSAEGWVFLEAADSRLAAHAIIRHLYDQMREAPQCPITHRQAAEALTRAFLTVNWDEEKENFTNMEVRRDPATEKLSAWRTLAEIGWTGGGVIGYPLITAGHVLGDALAAQRGRYKIDWVSLAANPASGLLWDVCGKHEGRKADWWWSGYLVEGVHCAYTNASGLYYMLRSYDFCHGRLGETHPRWLATALDALDTVVGLQRPDGNFGYTYSIEEPRMIDAEGFAGAWFLPALVLAYRQTGRQVYLDAARRGAEYYHGFVRGLCCWGTPMDTWKTADQEGNLGFLRGALLLHETVGDDRHLAMLLDSVHYEYLWRYGFRARPEFPPLKGSHWNSCGGSVTSVSNPHIHPMGTFITSELQYLAQHGGDDYHARRAEDGLSWGVNAVSLYPQVSGYGEMGVLTERYCPSDGLVIETFPDGSPSSMWFSYNGWATAAVLEGIVEQML